MPTNQGQGVGRQETRLLPPPPPPPPSPPPLLLLLLLSSLLRQRERENLLYEEQKGLGFSLLIRKRPTGRIRSSWRHVTLSTGHRSDGGGEFHSAAAAVGCRSALGRGALRISSDDRLSWLHLRNERTNATMFLAIFAQSIISSAIDGSAIVVALACVYRYQDFFSDGYAKNESIDRLDGAVATNWPPAQ